MSSPAIPPAALTANRVIVDHLTSASTGVTRASSALDNGQRSNAEHLLTASLDNLHQAQSGIARLTDRTNLLDGAAPRWATHAETALTDAVSLLTTFNGTRLPSDVRASLLRDVDNAASSTRLATESATRSLKHPTVRALARSTSGSGSTNSEPRTVTIDGYELDALGNPVSSRSRTNGPDSADDGFGGRETSSGGPDDPGSDFLG